MQKRFTCSRCRCNTAEDVLCPDCGKQRDPAPRHGGMPRVVLILLGAVLSIGFVGVMMLPVERRRCAARNTICKNNLHQIGLALYNYQSEYGSFPPAYVAGRYGRPMHSWRVLLLPYLDHHEIYNQYNFDEPWDGPNNSKLHDRIIPIFSCPSDPSSSDGSTSFVAVVGPETAWHGSQPVAMRDITDGASRTIFLVEMRNSGIHWAEPRDLQFDRMSFPVNPPTDDGAGISSGHFPEHLFSDNVSHVHVMMADGSVTSLPATIKPDRLKALLTIDGGEQLDEPGLE